MPRDSREATAQVTVPLPSSKDSKEEAQQANQHAQEVIQAAVQTGAAAQRAETAANQATSAQLEAEQFLSRFRATLKEELEPISNRLKALEELEEEETQELTSQTILEEPDAILATASAQSVKLEEPKGEKASPSVSQPNPPERGRGGGLLKRVFLNK